MLAPPLYYGKLLHTISRTELGSAITWMLPMVKKAAKVKKRLRLSVKTLKFLA